MEDGDKKVFKFFTAWNLEKEEAFYERCISKVGHYKNII